MSGPPQPTPRLPDGTVNLGRVPGEKGVWNVPYITNMGERVVEDDGKTYVEKHPPTFGRRSEEHTSELQSPCNLVCRLLLEKKNSAPTNTKQFTPPRNGADREREHRPLTVRGHLRRPRHAQLVQHRSVATLVRPPRAPDPTP